ncbi:GMC oxidoreductase [Niveispirillum fermenti]|uniref:GMC oxidoreductase n=1 Tax=Niveispirillum fermenti TaxID=1233113 RepID=UPI003A855F6E
MDWDAIVVGSGITGGWAAKELCEKGLKTLVIERGRQVEHAGPDYTDFEAPWEIEFRNLVPESYAGQGWQYMKDKGDWIYRMQHLQFFADTQTYPFSYPDDRPFMWTRGYQLGGRSLTWWRQSYRWGEADFTANARDGHGVDWPIRYGDLAPWYDHVERFAGIAGSADGLDAVPDGVFQPPFEMNCAERQVAAALKRAMPDVPMIMGRTANLTAPTVEQQALGRGPCQARSHCSRGCSYGAYFSSLSATLPAARNTGNLTVMTDAICHSLEVDPATGRVVGVRVINAGSLEATIHRGRLVFLCASAIGSAHILLNSRSDAHPRGLANGSDALGRHLMDHVGGAWAAGRVPGLLDRYPYGRRPNDIYIPNYRTDSQRPGDGFIRGFGFQGSANRGRPLDAAGLRPGIGKAAKQAALEYGPWTIRIDMFGEMLPHPDNRLTLHPTKVDRWGIPLAHLDCTLRANEKAMIARGREEAAAILTAGGCEDVTAGARFDMPVGSKTHEMGTARMGRDPASSVLNAWNQAHEVANLFVTDGACMASSGTQNPSLTYMALTARAAGHAVELLREGRL